jgi:TonB family protein
MNRLQKKCIMASAGMHLLLVVILLVGPAFISSKSKTDDLPILDFIPVKTVDALVSGGGDPKGRLPSPPPATAQPQPPVQPQRTPAPPKQPEPEVAKHDPEPSLDLSPKPRKPDISLKPVVQKTTPQTDSRRVQALEKERRELADLRRRTAEAFGHAAEQIGDAISSSTTIALKGPGGGGVPYANFLQAVKTIYANAWVLPDGVTDDDATVAVSVTIARDGKVVISRITRSSSNAAVDRSVQVALDRVRRVAPLPDDASEDQRTVTINFNVKAKRALG